MPRILRQGEKTTQERGKLGARKQLVTVPRQVQGLSWGVDEDVSRLGGEECNAPSHGVCHHP